jgi:uncharacterized protein YgfB (UPF0149 family)
MKILLSILLLLITSTYILPVKEMLAKGNAVCMADMDEEKEENEKKEKSKELFSFSNTLVILTHSYHNIHQFVSFNIPVPLHTIETPPPDLA